MKICVLRSVLAGWILRKIAVPISQNLRAEVVEQLAYIREWGGQFVTAVPSLKVS